MNLVTKSATYMLFLKKVTTLTVSVQNSTQTFPQTGQSNLKLCFFSNRWRCCLLVYLVFFFILDSLMVLEERIGVIEDGFLQVGALCGQR